MQQCCCGGKYCWEERYWNNVLVVVLPSPLQYSNDHDHYCCCGCCRCGCGPRTVWTIAVAPINGGDSFARRVVTGPLAATGRIRFPQGPVPWKPSCLPIPEPVLGFPFAGPISPAHGWTRPKVNWRCCWLWLESLDMSCGLGCARKCPGSSFFGN